MLPEPIVARKSQNKKKQRRVESSEDELDDESDAAQFEEDRSKRRKSNEGVARPSHTKPRAIATTTRKVASRPDPSLPSTPPSSEDGQGTFLLFFIHRYSTMSFGAAVAVTRQVDNRPSLRGWPAVAVCNTCHSI